MHDGGARGSRQRAERSDGIENRRRILDSATVVVARDGLKVPLATVACEAGVGIGTLYRHFPNRDALLNGLVLRSMRLVLESARTAAAESGPAIEALRQYFFQTIDRREQLILPLRGGPEITSAEVADLRGEIHESIADILRRGAEDGTIRTGVTSFDIVLMATMLAQPLPRVPDWDRVAQRTVGIYLAGLAPEAS